MKRTALLFSFLLMLLNVPVFSGTFPYSMPWNDSSATITDLSYMNHKPAGVSGYVTAGTDGRLYVNSGASRQRFFAVNVTSSNCFPEKTDAEGIAKRMAKMGINLVRFHLGDASWGNSFINYSAGNSRTLNTVNMDKFDWFFAKLKENGIYANINLLAGRDFKAADGLPAEINLMAWKDKQTPAMFNPVMIALQEEFAQQMFTHLNPYTGTTYASDPAVAFVEVCNEHGLIHAWFNSQFDGAALPLVFETELQGYWDAYLSSKYGTFASLQSSWGTSEALGAEKLVNPAFASGIAGWSVESHSPAVATSQVIANGMAPGINSCNITVSTTSTTEWHVQLNQAASITAGHPYTLSFSAKASVPTTIGLILQENGGAWATYFSKDLNLTTDWQRFEFVFVPTATTPTARLNFNKMADTAAVYSFADFSFRQGGTITGLKAGETDFNSVKIFKIADKADRPMAAKTDYTEFLWNLEYNYWGRLNNYLKVSLAARALTIGTVIGNSTPNIMNLFDVIDSHAYWQHPAYEGEAWVTPWWIRNSSVLGENDGGTIAGLAMKRVANKPFSVTEYNHPYPNSFRAETYPLLASYAALQDWDAIYGYTYGDGNPNWSTSTIDGFFDIDMDPAKAANFQASALIFRRGDVSTASTLVTVPLTRNTEIATLPSLSQWSLIDAQQAGMPRRASLSYRTAIVPEGGTAPFGAVSPGSVAIGSGNYTSDTNELNWNTSSRLLKIDTASTKAIIGFGSGTAQDLSGVSVKPVSSMQNYASIILSLIRGTSIAVGAEKILVTATGFAGNTGTDYRLYPSGTAAGSPPAADVNINCGSFGTGPMLAEGIAAEIVIPYPYLNVKAYSLDASGNRKTSMPVASESGSAKISFDDTRQSLNYEIEIWPGLAPTDSPTSTYTSTVTPGGPTFTHTPTVTSTQIPPEVSIDNCEDGNNINALAGYWYCYADAGSVINPAGTFVMANEGADGTNYSARIYGTIGAANAYIGLGTQLKNGSGAPSYLETDVTPYTGIQFYVKGDGGTYYIKFPYVSNTTGATLTGYNDYKYTFTAPPGWTQLIIPFTDFTQETGWGTAYPRDTVLQHAKEIQWQSPDMGRTFDLYVDEIKFYTLLSPSATPTYTQTHTYTATDTPYSTATHTATRTPTRTATHTATFTYTQTSTHTATHTHTFTSTYTPSATSTPTLFYNRNVPSENGLDRVFVYPSPFNGAAGHNVIMFAGLPLKCLIQVYNMKGELVMSAVKDTANDSYIWKISGVRKGRQAAPGIYIYVIKDIQSGMIKQGKLTVIK